MPDDREHAQRRLLRALHDALQRPGEVIDALATAQDEGAGLAALRDRFGWDEDQARAVANMQFRRVTKTHRAAIAEELKRLS